MSKIEKLKKLLMALLASGMATALSFVISLFLAPYISDKLGLEGYGFITLARNIITYASIVTMALNSYAARYITVEYHKGNREMANRYFASVFWGDMALGGAILVLGLAFIANVGTLLRVPTALLADVRLLFLFVIINFFISTASSVFGVAAYIKNCIHLTGIFRTVAYILQILLYLCLFGFFTPHLWYVGLAELAAGSIVAVGGLIIARTKTPEISISRRLISLTAIKQLVLSGVWNALNSLGNVLNSGLDLLISNLMLSAVAMGQLAVTKTLMGAFSSIYQLVSQAFQPLLLKSYSDGDTGRLTQELKLSMKVSGLFSGMIFAGMLALGRVFFSLWMPGQDTELLYSLTVLSAITAITEGPLFPIYYVYTLTVRLKLPCLITVVGGLLNVAGMYVLIRYFGLGVYAVVLTTVAVMTFINTVTNPLYAAKCLGLPWHTFYPPLFINVLSCGAMCAVFWLVAAALNPSGWLGFALATVCCAAIGCVIHIALTLSRAEKQLLLSLLHSKLAGHNHI